MAHPVELGQGGRSKQAVGVAGELVTQQLGSSGWTPTQHLPSLLPSCCRLCRWPGSSSLWAALPPLLPGPVLWGHVSARPDGLPAQLWVPPRPAVPGWSLCVPSPVPLPVPAQSRGSVSPIPSPTRPLSSTYWSRPCHSAHRGQPGLQDRDGQLLASPAFQAFVSPASSCIPPLVQDLGHRGVESDTEQAGRWLSERRHWCGGQSCLKGLPLLLCPQGSLRTTAGLQGLGSAPGRAWNLGRW